MRRAGVKIGKEDVKEEKSKGGGERMKMPFRAILKADLSRQQLLKEKTCHSPL